MSLEAMRRAFEADITPTQTLVLLAIADRANDIGEAWPAVSDVIARTKLSERAVRGAISELVALGWLRVVRRLDALGRQTSSLYVIGEGAAGAPPAARAPGAAVAGSATPAGAGAAGAGGRVQQVQGEGAAGAPSYIESPSESPSESSLEPFAAGSNPAATEGKAARKTTQEPLALALLPANHWEPGKIAARAVEPVTPGKRIKNASEAPTAATWEAYSRAYQTRYQIAPVRNAKVNGQLAQLVGQLGAEEAPKVAAYYLSHPNSIYLRSHHDIGLLLRDCQALRTQMLRGQVVTDTQAKRQEQTAANPALAILQRRRQGVIDENR